MKSILPMAALVAMFGSTAAFAGNMTIPMSFEYLAMDGQTIESSMFNHKASLTLTPGEHKIAIRYHDLIEDDFTDGQSFIKSAPFIITIVADQDGEYRLKPKGSNEVRYPEKFAKAPQVEIIANDGSKVVYSVQYTDLKEASLFSRLLGDNSGVDVSHAAMAATGAVAGASVPSQSANIAAAPAQPKVNTAQASTAQTEPNANPAPSHQHAEQMLQYWWLQADEQTRKQFMSWAIKQL